MTLTLMLSSFVVFNSMYLTKALKFYNIFKLKKFKFKIFYLIKFKREKIDDESLLEL